MGGNQIVAAIDYGYVKTIIKILQKVVQLLPNS